MTRTIATPEELDALPVGSVIQMAGTKAPFYRHVDGWYSTHVPGKPVYDYVRDGGKHYPATVLHDPSVPAPDPDDREALTNALLDHLKKSINQCSCGEPQPLGTWHQSHQADKILGLGFRRLTVTPERIEAGAKALAEWDGQDWNAPEWAGEIPRDAYQRGCRAVLEAALGDTK